MGQRLWWREAGTGPVAWERQSVFLLLPSSAPRCLLLFWPVLIVVAYGFS